ncbi:hypothetical protein ID866_9619 [Astraeus odoratus]|nr:hypothetical protein ID866_9619 [Astraeus odoratus]
MVCNLLLAWVLFSHQFHSIVYANSLLASLNSRNFLRGQRPGIEDAELGNTIHLSYLPRSSPSATGDLDPSRIGSNKFAPPRHDVLDISSRV